MPGAARRNFAKLLAAWRGGDTGKARWERLSPPPEGTLPSYGALEKSGAASHAKWDEVVWIVLNGGIGTSMEMHKAKSLVEVKEGRTFLDLLAQHVLKLRRRTGAAIPMVFMNSWATRADTLAALEGSGLETPGLPLDFEQHRFPRIALPEVSPFGDPAESAAWAPPGHGDIYLSLLESGVLDKLVGAGYRYAFVSNSDNLGASIDATLLGYMVRDGVEFMLEVTPKTDADVKGGTLVLEDGNLRLLEIAQVDAGHVDDFQDVTRFPAFNTNNVWMDLHAVRDKLEAGGVEMPLIANHKLVDGVEVVQLETAMGSAISSFSKTAGVVVERRRFAPVKTTDDLLVRRSDAYVEGDESPLAPSPARSAELAPVLVRLDKRYYKSVDGLTSRVPHPPSLVGARSLVVEGDVRFDAGVVIEGDVRIANTGAAQLHIGPDMVLGGGA